MTNALRIAPMSLEDLKVATQWAADEGWNPGLDDAATFHAIDPGGFLMGWISDRRATAISVVSHGPEFGFLGFYLCDPELRGNGYGLATWQAGMARLKPRNIGLDGVPAQEGNYRRSGFQLAFRSHRQEGEVTGKLHAGHVQASFMDTSELLELDRAVMGTGRAAYTQAWLQSHPTRTTMVRRDGGRIVATGTIRECHNGHKIGPLIAPDAEAGIAVVESLVAAAGAHQVAIDMPEPSVSAQAMSSYFGLNSTFACARMYTGDFPCTDMNRLIGLTTFELG